MRNGWFIACLMLLTCSSDSEPNSTTPPPPSDPRPPQGTQLPGPRPEFGPQSTTLFESGPVRPVAMARDGSMLVAANLPDARLEWFEIDEVGHLRPQGSIMVGIDPVAVAEAPDGLIWVVNHISDSVSLVDIQSAPPRITQTLWVGDEPRDIVFAGPDKKRAFITCAHRGKTGPKSILKQLERGVPTSGFLMWTIWVNNRAEHLHSS